MAEDPGSCSGIEKSIDKMERENFGSRIGMLMAMAGSAVGLGNIWRFPYLAGTDGGAAFIVIYIIFVLFLSLPIMFSEFIIGRRSKTNAFRAYAELAPGSKWKLGGIVALICPTMILSYYDVVGGWSFEYLLKACTFSFAPSMDKEALKGMFGSFISSDWLPIAAMGAFLFMTAAVVFFGIKNGIEKFGKIMMPVLFFVIVGIAIWAMTLPGAGQGVSFMFKPDFSKVNMGVCLDAMGQAFFSLSLGAGSMMTYASYADKNVNIFRSSVQIAFMDMLFAIIAGCAILPATFSYGLSPSQGPGLVFETLPLVFSEMPAGSVVAIFFFAAILVAAVTSSVSQYEVVVAYLVEERSWSRAKAVIVLFFFMFLTGSLCSMSFGSLSGVKIFGKTLFDLFDYTSANILMPLGGLIACLFVGWKMKKPDVFDEFTNSGTLATGKKIYPFVYCLIRYVAPIGIILIALSGIIL